MLCYTLKDFTDITFNGFEIKLPDETLSIITELSLQVGSPTYIKTPTFQKKEQRLTPSSDHTESTKKKRRGGPRNNEIMNDQDWESIRTFEVTKLKQKEGIDMCVDNIRYCLNNMTDTTFQKQTGEILAILEPIVHDSSNEDILCIGNAIFEFASNNRFYSKLYADLYTTLIHKFDIMRQIFDTNFHSFIELFKTIEYVDSDVNYEEFCKVKSTNERRKSLSAFFVNLTANKIISEETLVTLTSDLLQQVLTLINQENKKNEVDEMIENIAILYNKTFFDASPIIIQNDMTFVEAIRFLAHAKVKTYPSLSSKSIFKCMDMIDM